MGRTELKQMVNGQKFKNQEADACVDALQHTGCNTATSFVSQGLTILF